MAFKFLSIILLSLTVGASHGLSRFDRAQCIESGFSCLRGQSDIDSEHNWVVAHFPTSETGVSGDRIGKMGYAANSSQLPEQFKGKLRGDGIFWYQGPLTNSVYESFTVQFTGAVEGTLPSPAYMYVKYYGHVETKENQVMAVVPAFSPEGTFRHPLQPTSFYSWGEQIVQLNTTEEFFVVNVHSTNFTESDYFFVDTVILTFGLPIESVHDMTKLCPRQDNLVKNDEAYMERLGINLRKRS